MSGITRRSGVFRAFAALIPAFLTPRTAAAQKLPTETVIPPTSNDPLERRLPNGKLQRDEILRDDYERNVKDAAELAQLTTAFQLELEKSDKFVLSLSLLKKLDDIEKIAKRIKGRMRR